MARVTKLDTHAPTYSDPTGDLNKRLFSRTAARLACAHLRPGRTLHLGLGDGVVTTELATLVDGLLVVEGSPALVASTAVPDAVEVVTELFERFAPSEAFDNIIAVHVLEHVDDPVVVLRRIASWLTPDGRLFVSVPNAESIHRRVGVAMNMLAHPAELNAGDLALGHRRVYGCASFQEDLHAVGFELEQWGGFHIKVVSNAQMADWSDNLLDALYEVSLGLPAEVCADLWALCRVAD